MAQFCARNCMALRNLKQRTALRQASDATKLRVIAPVKKGTSKTSDPPQIVLHTKQHKEYESIIKLVLRQFRHKPKTAMPKDLKPMLATLLDKPFDDKDWQFEIKWDGYRTLAYCAEGNVALRSRNNRSFNDKYQSIVAALNQWPLNAVLDGEIVVLSEEGKADFGALQNWSAEAEGKLVYYVFDLLWLEGINLMDEPLEIRREVLRKIFPDSGPIRYSHAIEECGRDFFATAKQSGIEGIIAKENGASYTPGIRSEHWYKMKAETRHEAIICGYTKKKDSDRLISSLILGIPKGGELQYIGQVGTGFSGRTLQELFLKMNPLFTTKCPFSTQPNTGAPTMWVKPRLVCEVKYTELTRDGIMRHPSFQGLREDKTAAEINIEDLPNESNSEDWNTEGEAKFIQKGQQTAIVTLDGHRLRLTNLTKIYWPKEKIVKGDLLNYYHQMAPYILPYMKDRPQSLNRFPNGINGKSFYQKDMKGKVESWLKTFERYGERSGAKDFIVCTDSASLLYMANLGCIEMNPWHSRVSAPLFPDWCVIDLDPGSISFEKVIETANVVHAVLESLSIPSYPKTSGSTGIHIYIPLGAKYNYEQSRQLAELIATLVHHELPEFTSLVRNPEKRRDKIYIDYLQNRPIQTICAPYSVRPKPGATVSAPLHWEEVKKGLKISQFTIHNMVERVKREEDLFQGVLQEGIDLNKVLRSLAAML
jgi:bifunctional non-homologous end joining protein LigD